MVQYPHHSICAIVVKMDFKERFLRFNVQLEVGQEHFLVGFVNLGTVANKIFILTVQNLLDKQFILKCGKPVSIFEYAFGLKSVDCHFVKAQTYAKVNLKFCYD